MAKFVTVKNHSHAADIHDLSKNLRPLHDLSKNLRPLIEPENKPAPKCEYCGRPNHRDTYECRGCGAPL